MSSASKYWLSKGAQPTDRVTLFLGQARPGRGAEAPRPDQAASAQGQGAGAGQGECRCGGRGRRDARRVSRRLGDGAAHPHGPDRCGAMGCKGLVKLQSFTGEPGADRALRPAAGCGTGQRRFEVTVQNLVKGGVVARIAGVADRTAAEKLRGIELYLPREASAAGGRGRVLPRRSGRPRGRADRRHALRAGAGGGELRRRRPADHRQAGGRARSACPSPTGSCRWWIWRPAGSWSIRRWGCWRMVRQTGRRGGEARRRRSRREQGRGPRVRSAALAGHRAQHLSRDVPGSARPFAGRQGAGIGNLGAWKQWTFAVSQAINTAPWTTPRLAAAPAW